jgi:hypothetical protein
LPQEVEMKSLMVAATLFAVTATTAFAQDARPALEDECVPNSNIDKVVVKLQDGSDQHGSLVCLGAGSLRLLQKQSMTTYKLEDVRLIRKRADPVWDGAVKGASVSLLLAILSGGDVPGNILLRTAAGYGLIGAIWDSVDGHQDTIYKRGSTQTALRFGVRF